MALHIITHFSPCASLLSIIHEKWVKHVGSCVIANGATCENWPHLLSFSISKLLAHVSDDYDKLFLKCGIVDLIVVCPDTIASTTLLQSNVSSVNDVAFLSDW